MLKVREIETRKARRYARFARRGTESLEWGLVSGLLVAMAIGLIVFIGPKVAAMWDDANEEISATSSGGESGGSGGGSSGGGGGGGSGGGSGGSSGSGGGGSSGGGSNGGDDPDPIGDGE
ncbi:MAG: hypothetical protein ABIP55_08450 [Tepidisphaeraceae bacterium]